jgi:hypothetical protein
MDHKFKPKRLRMSGIANEQYECENCGLVLSADQVRDLLGFGSRIRPDEFLKQHGVYDYTLKDYEEDLLTLRAGSR